MVLCGASLHHICWILSCLALSILLFSAGVLRVWDSSSARCVFTQTLPDAPALNTEEADLDPRSLMQLLPMPRSNRLVTVTAEHNILIYQMPALTVQQQVSLTIHLLSTGDISWTSHIRTWNYWSCFSLLMKFVGYNDDILDVKFLGKDDTHIVVATNSSQLKVFELATNSCQILYGHTGEWASRGRQHCGYVTLSTYCSIYCVLVIQISVMKFGCNENTFFMQKPHSDQ